MVGRFWFAIVLSALAACSGASGTGLFAGAGGGGDSGVPGSGSGGDGSTVNPGDDGGGPGQDDASVDLDAGVHADAHKEDSGTKDKPFACGTTDAGVAQSCTGTLCCVNQVYDPFGLNHSTYACVAGSSDCQASTNAILRCHNGDECAGQYCCGDFDGTQYSSLACASSCNHTDAGTDHIRFCNPTKGGTECNPGESCTESTVLPGFYRCY